MNISVRKARHGDEQRLLEILIQVNNVHADGRPDIFRRDRTKYSADQLAVLLEDESRPIFVAVCEETGDIAGYGFCVILDTEDMNNMRKRRELYLDDLCVDEAYRRCGIGQILFDHIRTFAKEIGSYHLTLNVWECNQTAMRFYEKQGMSLLKKEMEIIL